MVKFTSVHANNKDIGMYITFYIQASTFSDVIDLSFDMIHQGTGIQELESRLNWDTWLTYATIWSNFASANASKWLAKGIWLYAIPYVSAYLQLLI